jgi:hypothetical protein
MSGWQGGLRALAAGAAARVVVPHGADVADRLIRAAVGPGMVGKVKE